jgi:hypothetical protein
MGGSRRRSRRDHEEGYGVAKTRLWSTKYKDLITPISFSEVEIV